MVLVGEDPASSVYVRSKGKATEAAGMLGREHRLPADTDQADLLALVASLNADPAIDGILVQLPLPRHIDEAAVIQAIDPDKDVDGFHPVNAGRLATGLPGVRALHAARLPDAAQGHASATCRGWTRSSSGGSNSKPTEPLTHQAVDFIAMVRIAAPIESCSSRRTRAGPSAG